MPDIAAEIGIGGFPLSGCRVFVNEGAEFLLQLWRRQPRQGRHTSPIEATIFIQGNGKGFGGGFDIINGAVAFNRTPFEDSGFLGFVRFLVVAFLQ